MKFGHFESKNRKIKKKIESFPKFLFFYLILSKLQDKRFSRVLKIFCQFFVQMKAEIILQKLKKFFTPSLVFTPLSTLENYYSGFSRIYFVQIFIDRKGGKKLLIWKVWNLMFLLHKKSAKNLQNSSQYLKMKFDHFEGKKSKKN